MAAAGMMSRCLQVNRLKIPFQRCNLLLQQSSKESLAPIIARGMAGGNQAKLFIKPSKYSDNRFLRLFKYYTLLTAVPAALVITYINVFVGEAEYAEIPEGYHPEHWEYHKHPITRCISKYLTGPPQKEYEKMLDFLDLEMEKKMLRSQEKQVKRLIRQRGDGHWYYYPTPSIDDYGEDVKNSPP